MRNEKKYELTLSDLQVYIGIASFEALPKDATPEVVDMYNTGDLEGSGLDNSDKKATGGKYAMRWHTSYAQYLWNGDVMYGNPTERRYGPKKISFTSALAHEEWAKYAREVYGEQWKQVYQAALKRRIK